MCIRDRALSLTRQAVALKPDNGYYVDSLGWAFYKAGQFNEALTEIKRAVALAVSYTHLRAHETVLDLVCRLLLEKKKKKTHNVTTFNWFAKYKDI